jgi:vacuolar-type H+-ATPase subunit H
MLEVETEARQLVENANLEANNIREKAREDAKQLVIDGKKELQERMQQEIKKIEKEAASQKEHILKENEAHLAEIERIAKGRIDSTVDYIVSMLLKR